MSKKSKTPEPRKKETLLEFISSMAVVLVVGLFIITFNLQAFEIPSGSMEDTLLVGDHVFVNRIGLAPKTSWMPVLPYRDPHQGDIIVFLHPAQPGMYVVKRVIGVPGDRIHLQDGIVYRNGQALNEPYVLHDANNPFSPSSYRDNFPNVSPLVASAQPTLEWQLELPSYINNGDLVVPPGRYFAMGDHRDVSLDSRYWGFVPRANIVGSPLFIYWSFRTPEDEYQRTGMAERLGYVVHVIVHFFGGTRWSRMLRVVH